MEKLKDYRYYIVFFLIAGIAYWQIVFFIHPVKYDMIDAYLPWRFYIGECLQHGKFPFWNPYQDLGYPIHADPSSGTWYPIVWIIGYLFGYNVYTIGIEMCVHVFIAAIGFYKLSKTLKLSDSAAFIAAISYMLCGVFIGNAQHITFIISACWIPFILNYYIKLGQEKIFLNSIKAALPLFMLITGGYPALTIILFYLLLLIFFYYTITFLKENKKTLLQFFARNTLFFICTILLSAGMLLSIYQVAPYLSRVNGFTLVQALFCPFSPKASLSFLLPFATLKNLEFFDSDLSMTNGYFGILMFLFFLFSLFIKKPAIYKLLLGFAIFSLLASFGKYLPVREFLFQYVPMMNLFRFPSAFRLFTIIGFVLLAAYWLDYFIKNDVETNRKKLKLALILLISVFIGSVLLARSTGYLTLKEFIKNDVFVFSKTSTLAQHIAFQGIIQSLFVTAFFIVIWKVKEKKRFIQLTMAIIVIELIFNAQLNMPYTAYYKEFNAQEANQHIKKYPSGFPPLPDIPIAAVNPGEVYFGPFWKNVNIFQKQVSSEGFNSFVFTGHQIFRDDTPQLYKEIIKNKIVFLSDSIIDEKGIEKFRTDSSFTSKTLFFNSKEFKQLKSNTLKHIVGDTAHLDYFAPDSFIVNTSTQQIQVLTLLQNNYTGWKAFVNDQPIPIYTSNKSLISIVLPAGSNKISFVYSNIGIKIALWVCIITLLLVFGIIAIKKAKREKTSCR